MAKCQHKSTAFLVIENVTNCYVFPHILHPIRVNINSSMRDQVRFPYYYQYSRFIHSAQEWFLSIWVVQVDIPWPCDINLREPLHDFQMNKQFFLFLENERFRFVYYISIGFDILYLIFQSKTSKCVWNSFIYENREIQRKFAYNFTVIK